MTDTMYYTENGIYHKEYKGVVEVLKVNNSLTDRVAVRSKSHASLEEVTVLNKYEAVRSIAVGSALKFCMIAEGKAELYYHYGPTMEWDIAAGQAILQAAGGNVFIETGTGIFSYNKASLLNGSFLCLRF